MIKRTCIIIVALCVLSLTEVQSHGESKSKLDESDFKLKQLIEKSDAIIMGRLQNKLSNYMGVHYLIKDAVVLKGDLNKKTPFIVVPSHNYYRAASFSTNNIFNKSSYLFFLKKCDKAEKMYEKWFNEWYEEFYNVKNMEGGPYRINGGTYGPYGVIPLEKNAQLIDTSLELAKLESVDQVDEDFIEKKLYNEDIPDANVKRFIELFRQEYEEQEDIDAEELRRMKQKTKKVNESLKAIKKLYGIDVPEEKDTFIAALKLLIADKEPDEETPKDVREMVKKLKSVNWSEPEEKRSRSVLDNGGKDGDKSGLDISFESE